MSITKWLALIAAIIELLKQFDIIKEETDQ